MEIFRVYINVEIYRIYQYKFKTQATSKFANVCVRFVRHESVRDGLGDLYTGNFYATLAQNYQSCV